MIHSQPPNNKQSSQFQPIITWHASPFLILVSFLILILLPAYLSVLPPVFFSLLPSLLLYSVNRYALCVSVPSFPLPLCAIPLPALKSPAISPKQNYSQVPFLFFPCFFFPILPPFLPPSLFAMLIPRGSSSTTDAIHTLLSAIKGCTTSRENEQSGHCFQQ